jgi:hypothetical protein
LEIKAEDFTPELFVTLDKVIIKELGKDMLIWYVANKVL